MKTQTIWGPFYGVESSPDASPQSQIKYLLSVVSIKEHEIQSLKLELKTLALQKDLKDIQINQAIEGLAFAHKKMLEKKGTTMTLTKPSLWARFTYFFRRKGST